MWPFGRKQETSPRAEPAADLPQLHFDWKRVPAIQPTIGAHPLTVQTSRFTSELASHADPRAIAQPLGHRVSLQAPPGLVLDFIRPQTRSEGPELFTHQRSRRSPIQRVVSESALSEAEWSDSEPPIAPAGVSPVPLRQLPVAIEPRPAVQLMRVTPETEPQPLPNAIAIPAASALRDESPAAVEAVTQSAGEPITEVPAYPRLTLGQARRLGLGAPISRVPGTATSVQRAAETPAPTMNTSDAALSVNAPEPPAPAEAAPPLQPFALDYLITRKPPPPAPTPISRRQRIQPSLTVSRSPEADPPGAEAMPSPGSQAAASDADPEVASADAQAPVQRRQEPAPAARAMEQVTPGGPATTAEPTATAEPARTAGPGTAAEPALTAELAGAPPIASKPDPTTRMLAAAAAGETGEGGAQPLPALPLAAGAGGRTVQRLAAPAGEDAEPPQREDTNSDGGSLQRNADLMAFGIDDTRKSRNEEPIAPLLAERPSMASFASPVEAMRDVAPSEPALPLAAGVEGRVTAHTPREGSIAGILPASVAAAAAPRHPAVQRMIDAPVAATRTITAGPMALRSGRAPIGVLAAERPSHMADPLGRREETATTPAVPSGASVIQRVDDKDGPLPVPLSPAYGQPARVIQRALSSEPLPSEQHELSSESSTPFAAYWSASTVSAPVQRVASQDWTVQAEAEPPSSSSVVAPAAASGHAAATDEQTHIDELATKLYDKIRTKLRNELLVDRERAGLLTDLR